MQVKALLNLNQLTYLNPFHRISIGTSCNVIITKFNWLELVVTKQVFETSSKYSLYGSHFDYHIFSTSFKQIGNWINDGREITFFEHLEYKFFKLYSASLIPIMLD